MPEDSDQLKAPMLANTAGEPERERFSRRANLMEAIGVMFLLLVALWWVAYPLGVLLGLPDANTASQALVALLFGFAMLVSPRRHADTLKSWGVGNPAGLLRTLRCCSTPKQLAVAGVMGVITAVLTLELFRNASGAGEFVFGIAPDSTLRLQNSVGGSAVLFGLCLGLSLVWVTCVIRYDNFWPALKTAVKILAVLLPLVVLVGWAANGPEIFRHARPRALVRNGLGYIFWGAVQQLLFCSYFGTRLRKSFAPAARPRLRTWKRAGVAAFNGFFFGLAHINSWLLVGFAWALGSILSWVFMEDRNRNLQALGLIHGVLGTCVIWLFAQEQDPVHIRLSVGPWEMPRWFDWLTVLVTSLIILGFGLSLALLVRRRLLQPGERSKDGSFWPGRREKTA